jgi:hypothetical protein
MTNRTYAAMEYLAVSREEVQDAIEAMSFADKRELVNDYEAAKVNGRILPDFKTWACDKVAERIVDAADAHNRSWC